VQDRDLTVSSRSAWTCASRVQGLYRRAVNERGAAAYLLRKQAAPVGAGRPYSRAKNTKDNTRRPYSHGDRSGNTVDVNRRSNAGRLREQVQVRDAESSDSLEDWVAQDRSDMDPAGCPPGTSWA